MPGTLAGRTSSGRPVRRKRASRPGSHSRRSTANHASNAAPTTSNATRIGVVRIMWTVGSEHSGRLAHVDPRMPVAAAQGVEQLARKPHIRSASRWPEKAASRAGHRRTGGAARPPLDPIRPGPRSTPPRRSARWSCAATGCGPRTAPRLRRDKRVSARGLSRRWAPALRRPSAGSRHHETSRCAAVPG